MPTTEGYNGAYTGPQIDEGIRKANEALPAPTGGTTGQILTKTEDGVAWENPATSTTITLTSSGWTGDSAPFSQQVACSIVAADTPVVSVDAQTSGDLDANAEILAAWALVSQKDPTQGAGTMTFYATEKPTVNIPVKVGVA